jgi:hypothetical protein
VIKTSAPVCNFKSVVFGSVSDTLPTGQLSNVPWRRSGVKYTNNEAYFDVIEEVDAIIDKAGSTVSAEIHGYVRPLQTKNDFFLRMYDNF